MEIAVMVIKIVIDIMDGRIKELVPDMIKEISLGIAKRVVEDHCEHCGMHRKLFDESTLRQR